MTDVEPPGGRRNRSRAARALVGRTYNGDPGACASKPLGETRRLASPPELAREPSPLPRDLKCMHTYLGRALLRLGLNQPAGYLRHVARGILAFPCPMNCRRDTADTTANAHAGPHLHTLRLGLSDRRCPAEVPSLPPRKTLSRRCCRDALSERQSRRASECRVSLGAWGPRKRHPPLQLELRESPRMPDFCTRCPARPGPTAPRLACAAASRIHDSPRGLHGKAVVVFSAPGRHCRTAYAPLAPFFGTGTQRDGISPGSAPRSYQTP